MTRDSDVPDSVEDVEDIKPEEENMNEEAEGSEDATPNNDFCFINYDFIKYRAGVNNTTRHLEKYREA